MKEQSFIDFTSKVKVFENYLQKTFYWTDNIESLGRKEVNLFLNKKQKETTAATRNSYKANISSLFGAMAQLDIIPFNFVRDIPKAKTTPKANKAYTSKEKEKIYTYLEKHDPSLLYFIQFFSYTIIRPIEAVRIKIKDIKDGYFFVENGKTIQGKKKSIPNKIVLPDLSKFDKEMYLFGVNGTPDYWKRDDKGRRDVYTKRFSKVRTKLGFSKEYNLYSFRHTVISDLYNKILAETKSHTITLNRLIEITEHESIISLKKYLRSINAIDREDYSKFL